METIILSCYGGREGKAEFEIVTDVDSVTEYANKTGHIWFHAIQGDARRAKVNGQVRRWKRDRSRIEVPLKYGMYEYGKFDSNDVKSGRILRYVHAV